MFSLTSQNCELHVLESLVAVVSYDNVKTVLEQLLITVSAIFPRTDGHLNLTALCHLAAGRDPQVQTR